MGRKVRVGIGVDVLAGVFVRVGVGPVAVLVWVGVLVVVGVEPVAVLVAVLVEVGEFVAVDVRVGVLVGTGRAAEIGP